MQTDCPNLKRQWTCAGWWKGVFMGRAVRLWPRSVLLFSLLLASTHSGLDARPEGAQGPGKTYLDTVGDARIRRADYGADGPVDRVHHRWPDIVSYTIGSWQPTSPADDLFSGAWATNTQFFRLDIVFQGLVNPPGPTGCCGHPFDPFQFGPNPVYGFIEIDMDADAETGGELDQPQSRYLGCVARFGGLPSQSWFTGRAAVDSGAFDNVLATPPFVDRSGEEFNLALLGWDYVSIQRSDLADMVFGPGEVWVLKGWLFSRAHGYERFSYACCHGEMGGYEPVAFVRFEHLTASDQTKVSLVYPMTNAGSAAMRREATVQPMDGDTSNQNSVREAMDDLVFSAISPRPPGSSDPNYPIIAGWGAKDPNLCLDPRAWRLNILVGTCYTSPQPEVMFAYTDVAPDVVVGDFNGNGTVNPMDWTLLLSFIASHDGVAGKDTDGLVDGRVSLPDFGPNFSVFDVNYDGVVDATDWAAIPNLDYAPADFDRDKDVDLDDFGHLQACLTGDSLGPPASGCWDADLDKDGDIDHTDMGLLRPCMSGALVTADPMCGR